MSPPEKIAIGSKEPLHKVIEQLADAWAENEIESKDLEASVHELLEYYGLIRSRFGGPP